MIVPLCAMAQEQKKPTDAVDPKSLGGLDAIRAEIDGQRGPTAEALAVAINTSSVSRAALDAIDELDATGAKALVEEAAKARVTDPTLASKWLHRKWPDRKRAESA